LVVIPCGIWPGDFSISFQNHEVVTAPTHAWAVSIAATCSGHGSVCSGSASRISTSDFARWVSGMTGG